jgi:hypothetical protein
MVDKPSNHKEIRCKWMSSMNSPYDISHSASALILTDAPGHFGERKRMCNQRFSSYQDLHRHLCAHVEQCADLNTQSTPCHLQCRWLNCSKQAGRLSDLRSHFIVHLEWKPFTCPVRGQLWCQFLLANCIFIRSVPVLINVSMT